MCFSKGTSVPHSTSCVSEKVLLCLMLPPVFQQMCFCASFYLMWLIPVPVFKQRYFSASFYLLCFRKGTFVPNSTSGASAKVLLCFILPPVFQQKYFCESFYLPCLFQQRYFCASFYLPCFSKVTSVHHSTSRVSAKVLLCLILPHVAHITFCVSAKLFLTLRASLSGTFLQSLPDLVTPLKGHFLSPRSCPATRSAPSERFGY